MRQPNPTFDSKVNNNLSTSVRTNYSQNKDKAYPILYQTIFQKMASDTSGISVCMMCFETTVDKSEKEDGEVVLCDKCLLQRKNEGLLEIESCTDNKEEVPGGLDDFLIDEPLKRVRHEYQICDPFIMAEQFQPTDTILEKCDQCNYTGVSLHVTLHKEKHHVLESCKVCQSSHLVSKSRICQSCK